MLLLPPELDSRWWASEEIMPEGAERRAFPRYRAEVLVDFTPSDEKTTGITHDVSLGGMFVRTSRLPIEGQKLLATLRFHDGRQLLVQGQVVRTFHPPVLLRGVLPTGFAMTVQTSEGYKRFVASVATGSAYPTQA